MKRWKKRVFMIAGVVLIILSQVTAFFYRPTRLALERAEPFTFRRLTVALYNLLNPEEEVITLVDVTPINRTRNFHNFSPETPRFFDDLLLRLMRGSQVRSRSEYHVQGPQAGYIRCCPRPVDGWPRFADHSVLSPEPMPEPRFTDGG